VTGPQTGNWPGNRLQNPARLHAGNNRCGICLPHFHGLLSLVSSPSIGANSRASISSVFWIRHRDTFEAGRSEKVFVSEARRIGRLEAAGTEMAGGSAGSLATEFDRICKHQGSLRDAAYFRPLRSWSARDRPRNCVMTRSCTFQRSPTRRKGKCEGASQSAKG
jgi:hypothetical protein